MTGLLRHSSVTLHGTRYDASLQDFLWHEHFITKLCLHLSGWHAQQLGMYLKLLFGIIAPVFFASSTFKPSMCSSSSLAAWVVSFSCCCNFIVSCVWCFFGHFRRYNPCRIPLRKMDTKAAVAWLEKLWLPKIATKFNYTSESQQHYSGQMVCVVVEQKKQQNLGSAIRLENSWTPLLQNPMVRSAYKLHAWKRNRNSHM